MIDWLDKLQKQFSGFDEKENFQVINMNHKLKSIQKRKHKNNFKIALIPHTLEVTNWKYIKVGDMVNVEIDIMAKYIKNFMDLR